MRRLIREYREEMDFLQPSPKMKRPQQSQPMPADQKHNGMFNRRPEQPLLLFLRVLLSARERHADKFARIARSGQARCGRLRSSRPGVYTCGQTPTPTRMLILIFVNLESGQFAWSPRGAECHHRSTRSDGRRHPGARPFFSRPVGR